MGETKWTNDQLQVIELRERNILVSAAAGSGKTAVLVERIIQKVADKEHPVDIDRLLVVTFTRAAAAEMRSRIGAALEKCLLDAPEDEHLQKQLSLLHNADIMTIDSFCQKVIRNYFHVIDLDPVFRVADEAEITLIMSDVLKKVLEEQYEKGDEDFLRFADLFSPGRTDSAIEDLILHMYHIAVSYPWPEEWLDQMVEMYQADSLEDLEQCQWMKELLAYLSQILDNYYKMAKKAEALCQEGDGPDTYLEAIQSDVTQIATIVGESSYLGYSEKIRLLNKMPLSRKKTSATAEKKQQVKDLREQYMKKGLEKLQDNYFFQSPEKMLEQMQQIKPLIQVLATVTKDFMRELSLKKREEGLLDFNDMEHFALNILIDHEPGTEDRPSETAMELQEYYEEILTDEYQDSNFIQELLLTSISRGPKAKPYLFMVGDVKQSIYQFRLARPELFNEKYETYTVGQGPCQRIDLHQNFRSRASVLESANYIFRMLMQKSLGGIVYDQAASLVPGREFAAPEDGQKKLRTAGKTQVMVLEQNTEDEEALDKISAEAAAIGNRILSMVQGEEPLCVTGENGYHRVEFRDIVILLRSPGSWTDNFIEVLTDMGIPAYSETKTGYFSTMEVETILNFLRVIDNPRQDIPLAAVLRSCIVGLTEEELAMIGAMPREFHYLDGILAYIHEESPEEEGSEREAIWSEASEKEAAEEDGSEREAIWSECPEEAEQLREKLSRFWDMLKRYQELAQRLTVYELLRRIYQETNYYYIMSAMPAGEKRAANLDILLQQAVEFAARGHGGIFSFVRYIESLHKSNIDFGEASLVNENMNAVRIMSIHKSKGLEFPVVFVAGLGKQFNMQDARKGTIIDPDYGVGAEYVDETLRYKQPTLMKRFLANRIRLNTLAEEVRILYVALTRAKELLILTGTAKDLEKKREQWEQPRTGMSYVELTSAANYLDWIMPVVCGGAGAGDYFQVEFTSQEETVADTATALAQDLDNYNMLLHWDLEKCYDKDMERILQEQTAFSYPFEKEKTLPVKISVSQLKRLDMERKRAETDSDRDEEYLFQEDVYGNMDTEDELEAEKVLEIPRPVFLAGKKEIGGAAKGTLYHLAMEHLPYEHIEETGIESWLEDLCQQGYLRQEEKALLKPKRFARFLKTDLGRRMKDAACTGKLYREQPFMIGLSAKDIYPETESEEMVLVQGIIDAWFVEDGNAVLVDYKTDFVKKGHEKELVEKYQAQLDYYAQALERLTNYKVREKIIYSFSLGKEIPL